MQSTRLLSLLLRLQAQGRVSAPALAEALEVSVRTVYRDIDALSAAGVPVYAERGRGGGFMLREGYRTQLTGLDRPEAEALFFAGVPHAAAQLGLGPALETTRLKLLAALPEAERRNAERVASRFHLDPVAWFQGADEQALLPPLAAAVWAGCMLSLRYESWKGPVQRRVAPLGLVLKGGLWYLVAAVGAQPRTYRVGAIESLEIERESPTPPPPPGFDLRRYWEAFARDYETRMASGRATVRADAAGLKALARLNAATAKAVAQATASRSIGRREAEGWTRLEVPVESVDAAAREMLRLAPHVQAVAPPELRKALKAATRTLASIYDAPRKRRRE